MPKDPANKEPVIAQDNAVMSDTFIAQLGFQLAADGDRMLGEMHITPELLVPGHDTARISVLATAGDVLIGHLANDRTPALALTVELSMHLLRPIGTGLLRMESRLVKVGRTLVSGEATWYDSGGERVAYCWATFMASPRPIDAPLQIDLSSELNDARKRTIRNSRPTMTEPFADALKIRTPEPGVAEVDRRPFVLQPTGTLQGAVVCALGEIAAESVLDGPITSLDTRYLSGIRVGSGRATAETLGPQTARVEVIDTRRENRVAAVLHARSTVHRC